MFVGISFPGCIVVRKEFRPVGNQAGWESITFVNTRHNIPGLKQLEDMHHSKAYRNLCNHTAKSHLDLKLRRLARLWGLAFGPNINPQICVVMCSWLSGWVSIQPTS